jgi:hypothetical protein
LAALAAPAAQTIVAQADKTRRIGVLMNLRSDDPEGQNRLAAFVQALQQFGWIENSNIRTDVRFYEDDTDLCRRYAGELVALAPDVHPDGAGGGGGRRPDAEFSHKESL